MDLANNGLANGSSPAATPASASGHNNHINHHQLQMTTQTWPFVEIFAHKRYFYLEAQAFTLDGHPEIFLWLWFLGIVWVILILINDKN